ncbi:MAG: hypothetical protein EOO73_24030 [Myxococcales bacterium]|nr:MAG: hypothetical protein EOO73_24030 [Myxococcales bacterium]
MRGKAAALTAAVLAVVAAASSARAEVSMSTEVRPRQVEVNARFILQLRASASAGEQVGTPNLKLPPGITGSGPNIGQQSQISIVNGRMTQSVGISATWVLSASKPGKYKLGPVSIQTDQGVVSDRVVTVEVVPQGSLPAPLGGQPGTLDPFNMLRGMGGPGFPGFPDLDEQPAAPQLPELPSEFRVERPLDPIAFLRARAVPKKVVVGEQVTLGVYAYAGRGSFEPGVMGEPSRNDFLAFNLMEDARQLQGYQFDLEGQRWITAKIAEFALFPLKAGKLKAGEMTMGFVGRNYSRDPRGVERKSQAIEIRVVEPPLEGRPPGYKLGDVGTDYRLSVQVEPREVPAGGSVSVVAKLKGIGNLPYSLLVPEQHGVRFLEPQLVEQIAPQRGVVQGFRTFTYVVELSEPGERDLGEVTLPYWDPKAKGYAVARAALGVVKVTGSAKKPNVAGASRDPTPGARLRSLVTPPPKLSTTRAPARREWPAERNYWLVLLGLPLTTLLGFAIGDLFKKLRQRVAQRSGSLSAALEEALSQLTRAARAGDAAQTASAAERALFLSIEKGTGIKARGLLKAKLAETLTAANVPADAAEDAARLLDHCDELRFAGEAADLQQLATEARNACRRLGGK